jgi:imidazolonepropionase-like amidohydrolase
MRKQRKEISIFLILLFLTCAGAPARQLQPRPAPVPVVIKAGKLLDVRTGEVTTKVFILIEKDKIVSLGNSALPGVPVIDLSNQTILPGLIDCHVHLLLNWKDQSSAALLRVSSAQGALWVCVICKPI